MTRGIQYGRIQRVMGLDMTNNQGAVTTNAFPC